VVKTAAVRRRLLVTIAVSKDSIDCSSTAVEGLSEVI
jgi:hypothetical protein